MGARAENRGLALIEVLIAAAIVAVLAMICVPNYLQAHTGKSIAKLKDSFRKSQIALESFTVDNKFYPPDGLYWTSGYGGDRNMPWLRPELVTHLLLPFILRECPNPH